MQAGDDNVLKSMERWYDTAFYRERVEAVRKALPDCGITADVMVGYPTETEAMFDNTYRFIDHLSLSGLHVFRFSARETTKAAQLPPLDPRVIQSRAARLGALDTDLRARFFARFADTVREALPEPSGEGWTDNYIRIGVPEGEKGRGLASYRVVPPAGKPVFS
jgi:threonylcarbamoyladenosine tRNA methylthiotransferase MtaB